VSLTTGSKEGRGPSTSKPDSSVGRASQAEQPPQRVRFVAGPEQASAPQLRDQTVGELGQVVRQHGRAQPEAGQPGLLPFLQQVGQADGGAGKDAVVGLQVQPVLDGEEVQQAALGVASQLGPVAGGEQPLRLRVGLAPRGGMPAGAVEGDRQVQGSRGGHHDLRSGSDQGPYPVSGPRW
jgi:hypothetical protein